MTHVGRYQIVEEVGRGATGVVFKALDPAIGRTVAIKAIRISNGQDQTEREQIQRRIWREARAAGVLSHSNIVTVHDVVDHEGAPCIVMEYVDGQSLAHLLRNSGANSLPQMLAYLSEVAGALDYAHRKGLIHRDVKPANILIAQDPREGQSHAKVTDFGIAKFISQETIHSETMIGTPSYLSPEQIEGCTLDGRSDQFSLAVVSYELLTGQKPFDAQSLSSLLYQICRQNAKPADAVNRALPPSVSRVLDHAMSKDPPHRFDSCSAFISALESAITASKTAAAKEASSLAPEIALPAGRSQRRWEHDEEETVGRLHRRRLIAITLGLFAILLGAGVAIQRRNPAGTALAVAPKSEVSGAGGNGIASKNAVVTLPGSVAVQAKQKKGLETAQKSPLKVAAVQAETAVSLTTEPAGASVQIDDRPDQQCTTPCSMNLISGRHVLSAAVPGFTVAKKIFNVPAEQALSLFLERSFGVVLMTSEPSGSEVSVDGKPSGKTPVRLRLSVGPHQVTLTNGQQRHEETVTVTSDEFTARNLRWP